MLCKDPTNDWCEGGKNPCFECATQAHDEQHPEPVDGCMTCHHRSVQLSPAATPNKTRKHGPIGFKANNSWERGIVTDARGMPLLKADGNLIRQKEYAENRRKIETARRDMLTPASS